MAEPWTVECRAVGGKVRVSPENGMTYILAGAIVEAASFSWGPASAKYTSRPKRLARLVASCQRWCDRQNAKEQANRDRTAALLASAEAINAR